MKPGGPHLRRGHVHLETEEGDTSAGLKDDGVTPDRTLQSPRTVVPSLPPHSPQHGQGLWSLQRGGKSPG